MPDNTEFLETDTVVHNLLEELNKLKSAVDQIEDTKNSAKTIQESADNIVRGTTELLTIAKTILNQVDEVRFKERFDEVEKLGKDSAESNKTMFIRMDEIRFKERFDEVEKLGKDSVENDKMILNRMNKLDKYSFYLSIGIIGILVFQAALLVFLYLM